MEHVDSSFGRLTHAWHPAMAGSRTFGGRPLPALSAEQAATGDSHVVGERVLLVGPDDSASTALAEGLAGAVHTARSAFQLTAAAPLDAAELEQLLQRRTPRVLVIDVEACALLGLAAVRHLRRLRPATDWVVGWREPSVRWLEILIHSQARGCIAWGAPPHELIRTLDSVLAGELWFPRSVMQWLYTALLAGPAVATPAVQAIARGQGPDLSAREVEVMSLMRLGLTNKQIAERLHISINTVKKHLGHAFEKRGLHGRRQALG